MDPVLLILAGVTAFILFRLISVMGTRTGHEQSHDLDALQRARAKARDDSNASDEPVDEPAPPKPVSTNARTLREADPSFDEIDFLKGARAAYEMIVEAFAAGDLKSIRSFLSDDVYGAFKSAVVAREQAGQTSDLKFVGIDHAAIIDSRADADELQATVEFASNQVRVTRNAEGDVVDGDPNRIDLVKDKWTFARRRQSRDPNWTLIATGGAA